MVKFDEPPGPPAPEGPGEWEDQSETIALLQEEIARLEAELLARDDECSELESTGRPSVIEAESEDTTAGQEVERLRAELSAREETLCLLLDQLRQVEEAETASRAEFEELARWVADVEERVERQDRAGAGEPDPRTESALRQAEEARNVLECERQGWIEDRSRLEAQIARLESALSSSARESNGAADAADGLIAMEAENRRLRQACLKLEEDHKARTHSLTETIERGARELDEARKELATVQDERCRERREYDLAVASLRSQVSRASLAAADVPVVPDRSAESSAALDADMRIRAFRQHLKEIHCHEAETKERQRLGLRLSRLWSRTTPG
jgi:uncharacterized small protein (DUF1192 family)